jgi:hypothetical protein
VINTLTNRCSAAETNGDLAGVSTQAGTPSSVATTECLRTEEVSVWVLVSKEL